MGYDYYYSGSSTAGPTSPLYSMTSTYDYNVSKSINYYLNTGVPPHKLVLGLPYYGIEWPTSGNSVPSSTTSTGSSRTYRVVKNNTSGNYSSNNKYFNYSSFVPYYVFHDGTSWRQCWIDDGYTLGKKMELIWKRGIAGIAIWALGYDDGYADLWNKIEEKLTTCFSNACSDTIFDMGGPDRNYYNNENYIYTISPANAYAVQLTFQSFNLEANKDSLWLYNGPNISSPLIGAFTGTNSPGIITTTQPFLTLRFKSDGATTNSGFMAKWQCLEDIMPPTTNISTQDLWKTQDFTATFSDSDNYSVEKSFYQVLDFDGQYWGANSQRGFFGDNFDILQPHWTIYNGTWNVINGELIQSDEALTNTNIYASLNQTLSNRYLFHFKAKVSGSGTNKRFGFHFFSNNANLPNRGNSYFIWFRVEDKQLQFYKVINDTFHLKHTISNIITNVNQMYDFKITYDRILGKICVWRDDVFLGSWTDNIPYSSNGNYISFRTGNSKIYVTELKVYRSRFPQVTVTLGDMNKDIRYQNSDPQTYAAKIKSIVVDANNNLSAIAYHDLNVDWSKPIYNSTIRDGLGTDTDTITSNNIITGNWNVFDDQNSGIAEYWYSIGTQPGIIDVIGWTNNHNLTYFSIHLNMQQGQIYYINVKAKNNAGLWSNIYSSDGAISLPNGMIPISYFTYSNDTVCSGQQITFYSHTLYADSLVWFFNGGTPSTSYWSNPTITYDTPGVYYVTLNAYNANGNSTYTDSIYVLQSPVVNFSYTILNQQSPFFVVFNNLSQYASSYIWNFGDGNTSNDVSPYNIYNSDGIYTVVLTAIDQYCTSSHSVILNLQNTELETFNKDKLIIYPNPAKDWLMILTTDMIEGISIFNNLYQKVLEKQIKSNLIPITTLSKGIYYIKIKISNESIYVRKFIKE